MLNFKRISSLYLCAMILFFIALATNFKQPGQQKSTIIEKEEKQMIAQHVVEQLQENNEDYNHNVWTTLATVMMAIGMLLSSERFAKIMKEHHRSIQTIHWAVFTLFCLHLIAYYLYQLNSNVLLVQMRDLVSNIKFYNKYFISDVRLLLNAVFDCSLFLLLSFIVDSFREPQ